jgi:sulfide:quinone oxidoreductase
VAEIVVLGAGLGGLPAAYELRRDLHREDRVTLIGETDRFSFVPSNPWVAVGWRSPEKVSISIERPLRRKGIELIVGAAAQVRPAENSISMRDGTVVHYDYLVIATGPKLAFDEIPGLGPDKFTHSVCTLDHAAKAFAAYKGFLASPGPVCIGAAQGASCFGPAYEMAMILDTDLRRRRLRSKVPMTLVTSEPWVGHLGLGGVSDSKGMLESELRKREIKWIANARIDDARADEVDVSECGEDGTPRAAHKVPSRWTMIIPPFKGVDAVAAAADMCNPRGFVRTDQYQRNPKYGNVYAVGVCVALAPKEPTPVPTGVPKSGYMIESMVSAAAANILASRENRPVATIPTLSALCLADMGDTGMAFVAVPQVPPRNITWARAGRWVHLAKAAFESYFLRKMRTGNSEPVYERWLLKRLGVERVEG